MKIQFGEKTTESVPEAKAYTGYSKNWPTGTYVNNRCQSLIVVNGRGVSWHIERTIMKDDKEWVFDWYRVSDDTEVALVAMKSPATWPNGKPEWGDKL